MATAAKDMPKRNRSAPARNIVPRRWHSRKASVLQAQSASSARPQIHQWKAMAAHEKSVSYREHQLCEENARLKRQPEVTPSRTASEAALHVPLGFIDAALDLGSGEVMLLSYSSHRSLALEGTDQHR